MVGYPNVNLGSEETQTNEETLSARRAVEEFMRVTAGNEGAALKDILWCSSVGKNHRLRTNRHVIGVFAEEKKPDATLADTKSSAHEKLRSQWSALGNVGHINFNDESPDPAPGHIKLGILFEGVVRKYGNLSNAESIERQARQALKDLKKPEVA